MKKELDLRIYLVTDDSYFKDRDVIETIEKAIRGGITAVQYRFKKKSTRDMYEELLRLRELTEKHNVLLFVNDRVDLAMAVSADGVHVGREDLPPEVIRRLVGDEMYIGYSVNDLSLVEEANKLPIDYIGFGSVYPTATKDDYKLAGIEKLKECVKLSEKPVVAIGGITHYRLPEVLKTGVDGVAIVSAILGFEDVEKATREFVRVYKETLLRNIT